MEKKPSFFLHYCRLLFPSPSTCYHLLFYHFPNYLFVLNLLFSSSISISFSPFFLSLSFILTPSPLLCLRSPDPHYCSLRVLRDTVPQPSTDIDLLSDIRPLVRIQRTFLPSTESKFVRLVWRYLAVLFFCILRVLVPSGLEKVNFLQECVSVPKGHSI
jgi:hypothetical protein